MLQELAPGSLVHGRFEVERLTGSGGMGAVYRAMDRTTMQPVAIKVLFDGADEARFHREALLLAELRHPGIVGYVAHGHTDAGHPFLAMQWLSGIDLAERLRHGGLNLKESLLLIQRIAEALSIAHKRGIIHRDIKPSNLFLVDGDPGKVVLLDFGIARRGLGVRSAAMTRTGAIIGTPEYMAPEQARGQSQLSAAADVFSLGCVFYECLAGSPPFVAAHVAAVLAKILFEDAPKLRTVRPELPLPLEDLLLRMLHKDPKLRPADGGAVLAALLLLPTLPTLQGPAFEHAVVGPSIRGSEQQLVSVLLVSDVLEVSSQQTLAEADDAAQKARLEALRAHLAPSGLHLEQLVDGSLLGTMHQLGSGAATDLAGRAARAALHIHERWSEAVVAIATGKGMLAGDLPVGEAVDRAAVLLRRRTTAGGTHAVLIDELTAGLLDARFEVVRLSHGAFALLGERLSIDESRKLLGKPTPCVGREQELLALGAVLGTVIEESTPRVALVVAPAGVGKSRLRHEFLRRTSAGATPVQVLLGRGDAMNPGAPFGLWSAVLRGLCAEVRGQGAPDGFGQMLALATHAVGEREAARVAAFLAELAGMSPPLDKYPPLHAARSDGRLFLEQATLAVTDFLRGRCADQPVVLVFEDMQWGDPQSIELTESALRSLPDSPLFVLVLARPEYESRLPKLGKDRGLQEFYLGGLGKRASERLVQNILGAKAPASSVARIVEQAAGNALYLEELIRAFAEGKTEHLPDTVLAMLQARVGRLPPEQRRVLRAASIFGDVFFRGGVMALLGHGSGSGTGDHIDQVLRELSDAEIIERRRDSRLPDDVEFGIRHSLMREAAYSLLTDDDRTLGHRLCAEYLQRSGEPDHAVLARHFELGSDGPCAVRHYVEAAIDSWKRGGAERTQELCLAARRVGAQGEWLGAVRCLDGQMALFAGRLSDSLQAAREGILLSPPGSRFYYWSILGLLATATLAGKMEVTMEVLRDFDGKLPQPDAAWYFQEAASLVAQLYAFLAMREPALRTISQMRAVCDLYESDPQQPLYVAAWQRAQAAMDLYLDDDMFRTQALLAESADTYLRFGQVRLASLVTFDAALNSMPLGDWEETQRLGRQMQKYATTLGDSHLLKSAEMMIGAGDLMLGDETVRRAQRQMLLDVVDSSGEDRVRQGEAISILAANYLYCGEWEEAVQHFRQAIDVLGALPTVVVYPYSCLTTALLRLGRISEATVTVEAGLSVLALMDDHGPYAASMWLSKAEVELALGHDEQGRVALRRAVRLLRHRLETARTQRQREFLLRGVPQHQRVVKLCEQILGEPFERSSN